MQQLKEGVYYKRPGQEKGILQEKKPVPKKLGTAAKILLAVIGVAGFVFMIRGAILIGLFMFAESGPADELSGIEAYDKKMILENYGGDIDSGLFIFPDNTSDMMNPTYVSGLKTGLFDTDGYIILQAEYSDEKYQEEVERLSQIECSITYKDDTVTQKIKYDTESYALPAYVTSDGFDSIYEYALLNEETNEISYILLSYPSVTELVQYKDYLKLNALEYEIDDALNQFTIYAHTFDGGKSWMEYSDVESIKIAITGNE